MERQWPNCSLLCEAGMLLLTVEAHLWAHLHGYFQCVLVSSPLLLAGCLIVMPNLFFQSFA